MTSSIKVPLEPIKKFCMRNNIRKLAVFGSALGSDFRPDSDIDILVEFEPGKTPGFAFFSLQDELTKIFGHKVDLNTPGWLSPYFRDEVMKEAEILYAAV